MPNINLKLLIKALCLFVFFLSNIDITKAQCDDDDDAPLVSVSSSPVGCGGGIVTLTFDFDDDDEAHDVTWRVGASGQRNSNGILSGHTEVITVTSSTTITIISVRETVNQDCISNPNSTIDIIVAGGAVLSSPTITQPTSGSNGSITVNASGGTAPLSYRLNSGAFQSSNVFSGLGGGTYTITVRDANNCEAAQNVTLTAPNNITLSDPTIVQPTCGSTNGSITVNATGGTAPLSYRLNSGTFQSSNIFSGLGSGTYTVTVRDANNNEANQNITLTSTGGTLTGSLSASSVGCGGGNVTITFSFPDIAENYDITWSVGGVAQTPLSGIRSGHQVVINITTTTTITLQTIGITDDDDDDESCLTTVNTSTTVTVPTGATLSAPTLTQPSCGSSNGSIAVNASGGTAPLSYQLNTGAFQISNIFSGLNSGSYTITVRDANNCESSQSASLNSATGATLSSPTIIQPTSGANGSITVNASGGTAPLSYQLNTGVFQSSNIFSNLGSSIYTITVRDANNCEASQTATLTAPNNVILSDPTLVQPSCGSTNGSIAVNASGGTAPLSYRLNTGAFQNINVFSGLGSGTYTVTVRDANNNEANQNITLTSTGGTLTGSLSASSVGCGGGNVTITFSFPDIAENYDITWSVGSVAQTPLSGIRSGHQVVINITTTTTITLQTIGITDDDDDDESCLTTVNTSTTVTVPTGATLSNPTLTQPSCGSSNGSIAVNASGGTAPLSYQLNTGTFQSSNTFSGLNSGSYTTTVRDANNCKSSQTVTLLNNNFSINATTVQPNCQNQGSITVITNGGTQPFTFSINGGTFQGTPTFSNLSPGIYTIVSRDGSGCDASLQVNISAVNINLPAASINKNVDITLCRDEQITFNANLPNGATGVWSSSDASAVIASTNQPNTIVKFIKEIDKVVVKWTLSGANCPNYSSDSIVFKISKKPIAVDDLDVRVEKDKILTFDVAANDEKASNWRTTIIKNPKQGVAILANDGQLTYTPNADANDLDTLQYTICSDICATACDTALVVIRNRNLCDLTAPDNVFPQGITPNGDENNQSLRFQIVDEKTCPFLFLKSDIQIFNRWGDRVFKSEPYNNDWAGKNDRGDDLPVGVYFYVLRIKIGDPAYVKFGSITIFR